MIGINLNERRKLLNYLLEMKHLINAYSKLIITITVFKTD